MPLKLDFRDYSLKNPENLIPLLDVRSPGEFSKGHIPHSISVPLMSDEQRAMIGKAYKLEGREPAILLGLELIGPQLKGLAEKAIQLCSERKAIVYCWRGGLRSTNFAELLGTLGFEVLTLQGGYKNFRKWVLAQFNQPYTFKILGGFTGSGKTEILNQLKELNQQTVDLEKLASHLGSVFGTLGIHIQPSQEQFENQLALELSKLDHERPIWLEDESRTLGRIGIPAGLWEQMREAQLYIVEVPKERRINTILKDYKNLSKEFVKSCILKISKRLGSQNTSWSLEAVESGDPIKLIEIMLYYYDRTYLKGQDSRGVGKGKHFTFHEESEMEIARILSLEL